MNIPEINLQQGQSSNTVPFNDWTSLLVMPEFHEEPLERPSPAIENISVEKTLPGFLMKFMRELNRACTEEELVRGASMVFTNLRKPDGTRYRGDILRSVKGALSAVAGIFEKDALKGTWTLNENNARDYEAQVHEKICRRMASKRRQNARRSERTAEERDMIGNNESEDKKRKCSDDAVGVEAQNMQVFNATAKAATALRIVNDDRHHESGKRRHVDQKNKWSHPLDNPGSCLELPKLQYTDIRTRRIVGMLDQFCNHLRKQPSWHECFFSPFRNCRGHENEREMWTKLGHERFVGVLQAYLFLRPLLTVRPANEHYMSEGGTQGPFRGVHETYKILWKAEQKINSLESNLQLYHANVILANAFNNDNANDLTRLNTGQVVPGGNNTEEKPNSNTAFQCNVHPSVNLQPITMLDNKSFTYPSGGGEAQSVSSKRPPQPTYNPYFSMPYGLGNFSNPV